MCCIERMAHRLVSDQPLGESEETLLATLFVIVIKMTRFAMNQHALRNSVGKVLSALSYREREILRLRFGLADGCCYTLEETGTIFGVTRERSADGSQVVEKLRQPGFHADLAGFVDEGRLEKVLLGPPGRGTIDTRSRPVRSTAKPMPTLPHRVPVATLLRLTPMNWLTS